MEYWIMLGDEQVGPLDIYQLQARGITADTPVWRQGLSDWATAGQLAELACILTPTEPCPPPVPREVVEVQPPASPADYSSVSEDDFRQPPTYLAWSIVCTVLCCTIAGVVAIIYSCKSSSAWRADCRDKARRYSQTALTWVLVSAVLGLISVGVSLLAFGIPSTIAALAQ